MFKTSFEFLSFDFRICFGFRYSNFEFIFFIETKNTTKNIKLCIPNPWIQECIDYICYELRQHGNRHQYHSPGFQGVDIFEQGGVQQVFA